MRKYLSNRALAPGSCVITGVSLGSEGPILPDFFITIGAASQLFAIALEWPAVCGREDQVCGRPVEFGELAILNKPLGPALQDVDETRLPLGDFLSACRVVGQVVHFSGIVFEVKE